MPNRDERIDAYITKSADFAKPILTHLRALVHTACPDVEETIKWSMPAFYYKGPLCSMAAFKQHCAFSFWRASLIFGEKEANKAGEEAMGHFGRITSVKDLPPKKELLALIKKAVAINEAGIKPPKCKPTTPKPLVIPPVLTAALKKNRKALATFEGFSTSHKREYADWIAEAKTDATRDKRLAQAIEWMAEGKSRHWKYQRC